LKYRINKRTDEKKVPIILEPFLTLCITIGDARNEPGDLMTYNKKNNDAGPSDAISTRLKDYYQSVEQEPIPGHFLGLLEKLDEAEAKAAKKDGDTE